ncbi:hypothetical protein [Desulfonatronum thioautotrophicum]|uniref:hypothetical protein n=1 Tax=Desulfonatronum thioautotrophicum TaxID=617001 RepID=UPI0005EAFC3E|nr:hypothetical protein [Desulfonatronum thioautotrophicum]
MRPASSLIILSVLLCVIYFLSGCQGRSINEMLWPDQHDPFFQKTGAWSRSGVVRDGLEKETRVVALLRSETWRRAYVQRYAEIFGLTSEEADKMLADQLRAASEETTFTLAVASTYPDDARLTHRLTKWRVLLVLSPDQTLQPLEIRPLDLPPAQLQAFYPHHHPWQRYYTVRFPKTDAPIELLFTGPAGRFVLTWEESD